MENKKICIIPARGGSKRIPGKNIRPFLGKPIIYYPLDEISKIQDFFSTVIVSTDSEKIAQTIIESPYKFATIHARSLTLSDDATPIIKVMDEIMTDRGLDRHSDIFIVLPTAVFFSHNDIKLSLLHMTNMMGVCAVNINKRKLFYNKYDDAGQFYWTRSCETDLHRCAKTYFIKDSIDINTEEDWIAAEKLKLTQSEDNP